MSQRYSPTKKAKILGKFGGKCAYCGVVIQDLTVDHIVPECKGGTKRLSNLYPSCYDCNHCKGDLSVEEFRKTILKKLKAWDNGKEIGITWRMVSSRFDTRSYLEKFDCNKLKPVLFYFEQPITYGGFTVTQDPKGAVVFAPGRNVIVVGLTNSDYKAFTAKYPKFRPGWGLG